MTSKPTLSSAKVLRMCPSESGGPLRLKKVDSGVESEVSYVTLPEDLNQNFTTNKISESETMWNDRRWYYASGLMNATTNRQGSPWSDKPSNLIPWQEYFTTLDGAPRFTLPTSSNSIFNTTTATAASVFRRTWRSFSKGFVGLNQVADVLSELSSGIDGLPEFKSVFTAHIIIFRVESIESGIYALDCGDFSLLQIKKGDFSSESCRLLRGLIAPKSASFCLIISADMKALPLSYHPSASIRDMFTHAGFALQRAIEVCTVYDLGTLPTPAMPDTECSKLLGLDGVRFNPVYSLTVGTTPQESNGSEI